MAFQPATGTYNDTIWVTWTDTASTTSVTSLQAWDCWNQGTTVAYTATITSNSTWSYWVGLDGSNDYQPAPLTEEQLEARRVAQAEREARDAERRAEQEIIRGRARVLLESLLDRKQKAELRKEGHFHVHTKDGERTYRLKPGHPPLRVKSEDGNRYSYCIHPLEQFPAEDTAAALKLLIEADEDEFLRIANATRTYAHA